MQSQTLQKTRAFTLVEMMVVITIIGMLTGLLLVGVNAARRAAKRAAILTEMQQIDGSFKELKNKLGAFPPNVAHVHNPPQYIQSPNHDAIGSDLTRFLKTAFPRHQEPPELLLRLVDRAAAASHDGSEGINGAEAVFFWLGGFSEDPRYPISGNGGPAFVVGSNESLEDRNFTFGFDIARLGPRAPEGNAMVGQFWDTDNGGTGRYLTYDDPRPGHSGGQLRINLWTYTPDGSSIPFVYYDTSRAGPDTYDVPYRIGSDSNDDTVWVYPIKARSGSGTGVVFANQKSFQLLHSGIDDEWGDFSALSSYQIAQGDGIGYPDGPFREEIADTLTNFSSSTLEDSEP